MGRITILLILLAALALTACGGVARDTAAASDNWAVFEGDSIDLRLPSTFEGGKVSGVEFAEKISQAQANDPSLLMWQGIPTSAHVELLIFGPADRSGRKPVVVAVRAEWPAGESMERFLDLNGAQSGPEASRSIETLTDDEARVLATNTDHTGREWSCTTYWYSQRSGSYVYSVFYSASADTFADSEAVFRASADSVSLREKTH